MNYILLYLWLILFSLTFSFERDHLTELGFNDLTAHFIICGEFILIIMFMLRGGEK